MTHLPLGAWCARMASCVVTGAGRVLKGGVEMVMIGPEGNGDGSEEVEVEIIIEVIE